MEIPAHLQSTASLINRAFPDGVQEPDYMPLLVVLYPHMSDENLATIVSLLTGRDRGIVLNDVYAAGSGINLESDVMAAVQGRLKAAGFDQWSQND